MTIQNIYDTDTERMKCEDIAIGIECLAPMDSENYHRVMITMIVRRKKRDDGIVDVARFSIVDELDEIPYKRESKLQHFIRKIFKLS